LCDRQCASHLRFIAGARHHHLCHHCQRIHRGSWRSLYVRPDRARPDPVRDHLYRAGDRATAPAAPERAGRRLIMNSALQSKRRRRNVITMALAYGATGFGLSWLVAILGVLLWEGLSGLSLSVFTEMTPPPGSAGGLLNPIAGSLVMTAIAVLIGTP